MPTAMPTAVSLDIRKMTDDPAARRFIHQVRKIARKHRVDVRFSPGRYVICQWDGDRTWGYFDLPDRRNRGQIRVCAGHSEAMTLHTLAHEFAHFLFWRFRNTRQPGRTYYEQEVHAETLAIRLLEDAGVDGRTLRKIRNEAGKYLHRVKNDLPEPEIN